MTGGQGGWNPKDVLLSIPTPQNARPGPGVTPRWIPVSRVFLEAVSPGGRGDSGCGVQQDLGGCPHPITMEMWGQGLGSGEQGLGHRGMWAPPECVLLGTPTHSPVPMGTWRPPEPFPVEPWGPQRPIPIGSPEFLSLWGHRDTQSLPLQGRGASQSLVPKETHPVLIPVGSCGPPEAPLHGDPPNVIPAGPWGPLSHPCFSSTACVSLSPWTAGHWPYQAQGTPCPQMDGQGVPAGFPPCGGTPPVPTPRAGGSIPALPTCCSRGGSAGRDTGTRGHTGTVPLPCRVCKHGQRRPSPPDSHLGPPLTGGLHHGPPPAPLLSSSSHHPFFFFFPFSP